MANYKKERIPKPDFENRKVRDLAWCGLFILFLIGMFLVMGYGVTKGDYKRVVNGMDYRGCICGTQMAVNSATQQCETNSSAPTLGSKSTFVRWLNPDKWGSKTYIWCTVACPGETVQLYCADESAPNGVIVGSGSSLSAQKASTGKSASWIMDNCAVSTTSRDYLGYCVPVNGANETFVEAAASTLDAGAWAEGFSSLQRARWIILASCFVAIVIAFVYLALMRCLAGPITWFAVVAILVGLLLGGYFLMSAAGNYKESIGADYSSNINWKMTFYGGIAVFVVAAIYLLVVIFMCKKINVAIKCVQLAGEALGDAPFLIFTPLFTTVLGITTFALWSVTAVYLASAGELKAAATPTDLVPQGLYKEFEWNDTLQYAFWYHLFGLFWTTQFILAVSELVIMYVVVRWYFSPKNLSGERVGPMAPVCTAWSYVMRYHLGSAVVGSLIIAIIQMIRAVVEYINRKSKMKGNASKIFAVLKCCCSCCLCCFERFMKYLTRQAYVQIALTGDGFCVAAKRAFWLVFRHAADVGALGAVSTLFVWLGKLVIMVTSSFFCYAVLTQVDMFANQTLDTAVPNAFIPCILVACLTYFIASTFMVVYSHGIEAILMCFIADEEAGTDQTDDAFRREVRTLNGEAKKHYASPDAQSEGHTEMTTTGSNVSYA